ncbi:type II toxin-antitoxin system RelE/ParE family toxin [Pseudomonas edaphica]|uniref:Type II toxin-antitoxin system RelE/ParE family toxin n=2 Tax=Pseudomonas TaxID=286 RepID=A0ABY2U5A9_9PSED|nr:type II toxin-antitoxin system RelE/ParE family toxin [Pseudomonas edaphica]
MELPRESKKLIGTDIKSVQLGWPQGMPLVRKLEHRLWEVRTDLGENAARVIFTLVASQMVLLHGFIKKSRKTPLVDLNTARHRKNKLRGTSHE